MARTQDQLEKKRDVSKQKALAYEVPKIGSQEAGCPNPRGTGKAVHAIMTKNPRPFIWAPE